MGAYLIREHAETGKSGCRNLIAGGLPALAFFLGTGGKGGIII